MTNLTHKAISDMEKFILLDDGRTVKRPTGKRTILPTNEEVWCTTIIPQYLGEDFEFTGRIKYITSTDWDEVEVEIEIVFVYDTLTWRPPFKKTIPITRWKRAWEFNYDSVIPSTTTEVIVDCYE